MTTRGFRIGLLGATGALGSEVLAMLDASSLRIAEIVPVATDQSLGEHVEFQDVEYGVVTEMPSLRGLDLVFCCAPPEVSLLWVREALRAEVPCVDCSGALLGSVDVPLHVAALSEPTGAEVAPVASAPPGAAIAWSLVLAPLLREAGLVRVVGTVLEAASASGRDSIHALSLESLALFNQSEPPEPVAHGRPIAFDVHPTLEPADTEGVSPRELLLASCVQRVLGVDVPIAVTVAQVPTFVGQTSSLAIELERPLSPKQAEELFEAADGVELWPARAEGPNLRAASGLEVALVGRVRRDPSCENGLLLWVAADALRVAATNAVALAVARLLAN
jgi:aspartate-semialdehyde dehydrogenase